jgi:hypothetical protein
LKSNSPVGEESSEGESYELANIVDSSRQREFPFVFFTSYSPLKVHNIHQILTPYVPCTMYSTTLLFNNSRALHCVPLLQNSSCFYAFRFLLTPSSASCSPTAIPSQHINCFCALIIRLSCIFLTESALRKPYALKSKLYYSGC